MHQVFRSARAAHLLIQGGFLILLKHQRISESHEIGKVKIANEPSVVHQVGADVAGGEQAADGWGARCSPAPRAEQYSTVQYSTTTQRLMLHGTTTQRLNATPFGIIPHWRGERTVLYCTEMHKELMVLPQGRTSRRRIRPIGSTGRPSPILST